MTKAQQNKNLIAFPICLFENEGDSSKNVTISDEIHIVPTGKWEHWSGTEFEITSETITQLVRNFKEAGRKDIPITAGHDNGMSGGELPAVGWFKDVTDHGVDGLYGYVEWNDEGKRLLREKQFKYFSAEIAFDFKDLESGAEYGALLTGGALTNKPFFKSLKIDPASFSEKEKSVLAFSVPDILNQFNENNTMDLAALLAKNIADLTVEEKAFIKENAASLTDEEKVTHAEVIADEAQGETEEEKVAREAQEAQAAADAAAAAAAAATDPAPAQVDASEKNKGVVTLSAVELASLRAKADEGAKAFKELDKMKIEKNVAALVFSASNKEGKFLPKQKDAVVAFMSGLTQPQRDSFVNIVNGLPKSADLFSEQGDNGDASSSATKALDLKAQDMMKADRNLKYSEALKRVLALEPELASAYEAEQSVA